jgi:hypothetical protein
MRGGIVAGQPRPEVPGRAPGVELFHDGAAGRSSPRGLVLRAKDRALVLSKVSHLLSSGVHALAPARMLAAVCEAVAVHFSMIDAVLFKSVAGQSRTLVWSAPGVAAATRMGALENAWVSAADLIDDAPPRREGVRTASASVSDDRLGLSALLYVESFRPLDGHDRGLLEDLLRHMLCLPALDG